MSEPSTDPWVKQLLYEIGSISQHLFAYRASLGNNFKTVAQADLEAPPAGEIEWEYTQPVDESKPLWDLIAELPSSDFCESEFQMKMPGFTVEPEFREIDTGVEDVEIQIESVDNFTSYVRTYVYFGLGGHNDEFLQWYVQDLGKRFPNLDDAKFWISDPDNVAEDFTRYDQLMQNGPI